MPVRLTPLETPAPLALVTGDPRRAFALAGALMVQPRMSHQARGLWGYTGETQAGTALTVQATGTGGPSAAAVLFGLAGLGVRRVVRVGTCVAPEGGPDPGTLLLVDRAVARDGVAGVLEGPGTALGPSPGLRAALDGLAPAAIVSSHDFTGRHDPAGPAPAPTATARDLQTAAIFAVTARAGAEAAALLTVAGRGDERDLDEAAVTEAAILAGRGAIERLETSA